MTQIEEQIQNAAEDLFGSKFEFRQWQCESAAAVVESVLSNVKHTLMEAPTGSGKSIIAIVAAYALHKFYAKNSYILVSDLSLFAQYERDIEKIGMKCFGCIKGKENYICNDNGCPASQSTCSLAGMSATQLSTGNFDDEFPCRTTCKYVADYKNAMRAPITLMTYQLYFIQRNYVEDQLFGGRNKNFPARDLVICDECHNICSICQSHFAPTISLERPKWMQTLDEYAGIDADECGRALIVNGILNTQDPEGWLGHVSKYASYLQKYCNLNEHIRAKCSGGRKLTSRDRHALIAGNRARQEHCKFSDMLEFIAQHSVDYVVKTTSQTEITVNFVYDDLMLKRYFHNKSNCEMMMSATIGDFTEFARLTGLDQNSTNVMSIPSTFDFSKSPIFYSTTNKMSYAMKKQSFPKIVEEVVQICGSHMLERGIIQSGNYENAEKLKEVLPESVLKRCIFYKGSGEKSIVLEQFLDLAKKQGDNHILVGPTLIEGLDFPNEACRFQICMKIPYAHLGNEYVRRKKDLVEGWYEYDALTKICQGIGRGVRHKSDWCQTYILDGCIENLIGKLRNVQVLAGRFRKL